MTESGIAVFTKSGTHREHWVRVLHRMFGARICVDTSRWVCLRQLHVKGPVLFMCAEDNILATLFTALLRATIARKTGLIYLAAQRCVDPLNMTNRIKGVVFSVLKHVRGLEIFNTLPFEIEPRLRNICNRYVPDVCFMDLETATIQNAYERAAERRQNWGTQACSAKIHLSAFGAQTPLRGTQLLMQTYVQSEEIRKHYQFAVRGMAKGLDDHLVQAFKKAGGIYECVYLDDADMYSLVAASDVVWCCFHPRYDVMSGVFGITLQLGRYPIVRSGSYLEKLYSYFATSGLSSAYDVESVTATLGQLCERPEKDITRDTTRSPQIATWQEQSKQEWRKVLQDYAVIPPDREAFNT